MSIMQSMFGGLLGNSVQAQPQQQVQPGNIGAGAGATNPANSTVPVDQPAVAEVVATPLAEFKDLWEAAPVDPNAAAPMFSGVDPKKLMEAAQKTDFSKVVTPEAMAKIQAGGQEGVAAMMQAMNNMSQTVYANSAMATTKIVEQALAKQMDSFKASLPGIIKQHTVSDNLRTENPALSNPAVQPFIQAMEQQFAVKHPGATSSELTAMAKQYVEGVGALFSPAAKQTPAEKQAAGEMDWSKFF